MIKSLSSLVAMALVPSINPVVGCKTLGPARRTFDSNTLDFLGLSPVGRSLGLLGPPKGSGISDFDSVISMIIVDLVGELAKELHKLKQSILDMLESLSVPTSNSTAIC